MTWPEKRRLGGSAKEKKTLGEGLFRKCDGCDETLETDALAATFEVCPKCEHHHKLAPSRWRDLLLDDGKLEPWDANLVACDPLEFTDGKTYPQRLAAAQRNTGANDAIDTGLASIDGRPIAYGAFFFSFMGGSMGSVVGEKIARLFEGAKERRLPVVLLQASGGARMQEGILSLMQMAKAVAAQERHRGAGLPFLSVLLHPTTGGVAASFAFLGDVNIAEPRALIGFAGARVIETTIRQKLPEGFQRAEFLLEHGLVDRILARSQMRNEFSVLLSHLQAHTAHTAREVE